jgi:hypothetical protein
MTIKTRTSGCLLFILPLFLLLLGLGVVLAEGEMLNRSLVSGGGGIVSQSGLTLHSATGQPVAGAVANDLLLCSGYWCGGGAPVTEPPIIGDDFALFLPLITSSQ